jgi:hypothetical protein
VQDEKNSLFNDGHCSDSVGLYAEHYTHPDTTNFNSNTANGSTGTAITNASIPG